MNYAPPTREERYQIYVLKKMGHAQSDIASVLERSESTISGEFKRNCWQRGYRPKQAHSKAVERRAINARRVDEEAWRFAQEMLLQQWSPEQIGGHADISPERSTSGSAQISGQAVCYGSTCAVRRNGGSGTQDGAARRDT